MLSATLSFARRAAVRAAAGRIVEAATGVILLLTYSEAKFLAEITAGQRGINWHRAAVPRENGSPLAGTIVGSGFRRNQRNRLFFWAGQFYRLCHNPSARLATRGEAAPGRRPRPPEAQLEAAFVADVIECEIHAVHASSEGEELAGPR
jgi:hypothetical protein